MAIGTAGYTAMLSVIVLEKNGITPENADILVTGANVCAGIKYSGVVTACGLAQGMEFPATVAPFILRGIVLIKTPTIKHH